MARKEIPLSEVLPAPAGGVDTGIKPPEPPLGIGHYRKFDWAPEIKAIAIIPDFVVPTANARNVLPQTYTRADVVCHPCFHTKIPQSIPDEATFALTRISSCRFSTSNALPCFPPPWAAHHQTPT